MAKTLLLFLIILLPQLVSSQRLPGTLDEFQLLDIDNKLPENLLSSRSAVFIAIPDKKGSKPVRGDWRSFSKEAHDGFRKIGIDAVAYYYLDDVNAGLDAKTSFLNPLEQRQIQNLIFIRREETVLGSEVVLNITKRIDGPLIKLGQPTYQLRRNAIGEIIAQLGRDVYANKLINQNYLILDQPEFFTDSHVVKGRRNESFNSDLKIGKLAVPLFQRYQIPVDVDSASIPSDKLSIIASYNRSVEMANQKLEEIMSTYPFKYELVDYTVGEEHLYRREFSYVLMFLHSTGRSIRELLNYDVDYNETDYITLKTIDEGVTSLVQLPAGTTVFKYYMKQLVNKEIYLGNQWDADLTWEEALANHLNNFKETFQSKNN